MKIRLDELPEHFTKADAELFDNAFEDFGENAEASNEQQQRILSRVMRKAGYDVKEDSTIKRTRKSRKRIVMILIAAAVLVVGALGAGAYYFNGENIWGAMKWRFGAGTNTENGDIDALSGITSYKGEMKENSFDELDISFSGAICDNEELYAIFTVSKKDGTDFTMSEGYKWYAGFTNVSYDGLFVRSRGMREMDAFHTNINDDGTLSVAVAGMAVYQPNWKKHDYKFTFTNLYCIPDDFSINSQSEQLVEIYEHGMEAVTAFQGENQSGHEELDKIYFCEMESISFESYEGEASCTVDSASLKPNIPSYEFEYRNLTAVIDITPIKIKVHAEGAGWDRKNYYTEQTVEVFWKDGTSETLECDTRNFGGNDSKCSWNLDYTGDKPIDLTKVDHIVFDGIRIDV